MAAVTSIATQQLFCPLVQLLSRKLKGATVDWRNNMGFREVSRSPMLETSASGIAVARNLCVGRQARRAPKAPVARGVRRNFWNLEALKCHFRKPFQVLTWFWWWFFKGNHTTLYLKCSNTYFGFSYSSMWFFLLGGGGSTCPPPPPPPPPLPTATIRVSCGNSESFRSNTARVS